MFFAFLNANTFKESDMFKRLLATTAIALAAGAAQSETIQDLSDWQTDGSGTWTYDAEANSWFQSINTPGGTFLFDPSASAIGKAVTGNITVDASSPDDDIVGFALGYNDNDYSNENANYFLLTWKARAQSGWDEGMKLWHVTGALQNGQSLWAPQNHSAMRLVTSANTLGSTGWTSGQEYSFDLTYDTNVMGVYFDDNLEFALSNGDAQVDSFAPGGFGFFNFSQDKVTYGGVSYGSTQDIVSEEKLEGIASVVPTNGAPLALLLTVGGFAALRRKK
jgi:hypothetical protein